jgi:hypothetical protein
MAELYQRLEGETDEIIKECTSIAFFMRGGIQYDAVYEITPRERKLQTKFLGDRLDIELKKMYPVY